jgi:hypothetical protein
MRKLELRPNSKSKNPHKKIELLESLKDKFDEINVIDLSPESKKRQFYKKLLTNDQPKHYCETSRRPKAMTQRNNSQKSDRLSARSASKNKSFTPRHQIYKNVINFDYLNRESQVAEIKPLTPYAGTIFKVNSSSLDVKKHQES